MSRSSENSKPVQVRKINIRFLSPTVLVFYSVLIFLACLPLLPVNIQYPLSGNAILFWLACFVAFLVGVLLGAGGKFSMPVYARQFNAKKAQQFLRAIVLLGLFGVVLLMIDRYIIRGVSLGGDVFENRQALVESQASGLSAIAAFASSIGLLSYIMIWMVELNQLVVRKWLKLFGLFNVLAAVYMSIELGSRSLLLVVALMHLFAWIFALRAKGLKLQVRHKTIALTTIAGLAIVSSLMMVSRVELMGFSMQDSVMNSAYAYTIQPSHFFLEIFQGNEIAGAVLAGLFSLVQYVFHGIYEFSLLFNNFQGEHEMGARTLWLPLKIISVLTNGWVSVGGVEHYGERLGVFTTFVGPVFVDFGWLSPLMLIAYGALCGLPFRLLQRGRPEWLPAVALVATCTLLWPVVNVFLSASGTYLLAGALVIGFMGKQLRGNRQA